jgi:hypothetical protein
MSYEYHEREQELEPQAASSRGGVPPRPRKVTGVGVLDPPVPPRRQPRPLGPIPASWLVRRFAVMLLIGLFVSAILLLFPCR